MLVLIIPTKIMITQMFNVFNHDQNTTSKKLTIANQSEVRVGNHVSVTCFTSIETKSPYFLVPFLVADIISGLLATSVFKKYIKNFNIQVSTMNIKHSLVNR